ncbi:MAG: LexA family transcriptional regulator [Muribaculaceae bacterium]|nr:LexA family transcriptional regulator [Muribaculaceae bacterium]
MEVSPDRLEMPAPEADVLARIRYLIRLTRHNQASFGKAIGVDAASVSRVLSGRTAPSESFLNRIVVNLGVSKKWLREGSDVPFPRVSAKESTKELQGAPVYNIDVTAGTMPLSRMFTEERIIGRMSLPGLNPELPIVRVSGDSMIPKLTPGCYISIRPMSLDAPLSWGQIYVVVLPDFRLVKYVRRHANPDYVILHSANPDYDDIEVCRSDIEGLYIVENIINHDFVA